MTIALISDTIAIGVFMDEQRQELIDEVMDCFDFKRVAEVMEKLGWTWASSKGIPQEFQIRGQARRLLKSALEGGYMSSGGLSASYRDCELRLAFELEEWTAYVNDEGTVVSG